MTKGECALTLIRAGIMPPNRGCTGDETDDSNPQCLTEDEVLILEAWVTDGQLE
ncbi:hypothetical protein [Sorangium cellulosum]|nr:hypothetical protein [Sorangium cellulosum]AGP41871.1 hypothetical protein SCE1572_49695 [Sorangium cellulosum So0157-2]